MKERSTDELMFSGLYDRSSNEFKRCKWSAKILKIENKLLDVKSASSSNLHFLSHKLQTTELTGSNER